MSVASANVFDDLHDRGWKVIEQPPSLRGIEGSQQLPDIMKVPISEFFVDGNILRCDKPVEIVLTIEDGTYYATSDSLNIDAVGESIGTTIEDFSRHLFYFYSYYLNKGEDEVIGNASRIKKLYENHFQLI